MKCRTNNNRKNSMLRAKIVVVSDWQRGVSQKIFFAIIRNSYSLKTGNERERQHLDEADFEAPSSKWDSGSAENCNKLMLSKYSYKSTSSGVNSLYLIKDSLKFLKE